MSILGNPITLGGGGANLNIDFGATPPADTSKLWVPLVIKPNSVECSPVLDYGDDIFVSQPYTAIPNEQKFGQSLANIGSSVYIIGGSDSNSTTAVQSKNISCYNVLNGSLITKTAKLPMPLASTFCAAIGTKIYIFGGRETINIYQDDYNYNTNVYCYDTVTDTIETLNVKTPKSMCARNYPYGCISVGTKIYTLGWFNHINNGYEIYCLDTVSNTFTLCSGAAPYTSGIAACAIGKRIYYFGGRVRGGAGSNLIQYYDTVEQKVTQIMQRLPVNTYGIGCCTVDGKIVYLFGGFSEKTKIYKFDTQSETLEAVNTTIPIQIQEEWCSSVGFDIYLIGGAGGGTYYTSVEKFSLSTPLQQNNLFLQADFGFNNPFPLINEKGIKITAYLRNAYIGNNNNIAQLTNAYLYDTVSSQWKSLAGESYVNDMRNALNILGVN